MSIKITSAGGGYLAAGAGASLFVAGSGFSPSGRSLLTTSLPIHGQFWRTLTNLPASFFATTCAADGCSRVAVAAFEGSPYCGPCHDLAEQEACSAHEARDLDYPHCPGCGGNCAEACA